MSKFGDNEQKNKTVTIQNPEPKEQSQKQQTEESQSGKGLRRSRSLSLFSRKKSTAKIEINAIETQQTDTQPVTSPQKDPIKSIDDQFNEKIEAIITKTKKEYKGKEYKGDKPSKFAQAATKVIADMKNELHITLPNTIDADFKDELSDFLFNSFKRKFVKKNGNASELSTLADSDIQGAIKIVREGRNTIGEYPVVNTLDMLQQSYTLGAHSHSVDETQDTKKYFDRVGELAMYIVTSFQEAKSKDNTLKFGNEDGKALANRIWQQYPFAAADEKQAQTLADKLVKCATIEETLEHGKNSALLSTASMKNLLPLQSLLKTTGLNAGFLHLTELKQVNADEQTDIVVSPSTKIMTVKSIRTITENESKALLEDVNKLISNNGKVPQVQQQNILAQSTSSISTDTGRNSPPISPSNSSPISGGSTATSVDDESPIDTKVDVKAEKTEQKETYGAFSEKAAQKPQPTASRRERPDSFSEAQNLRNSRKNVQNSLDK